MLRVAVLLVAMGFAGYGSAQCGDWIQVMPPTVPAGRDAHAMVHVPGLGVLLIGGRVNGVGACDDLWLWSNGEWTKLSQSLAPPPRAFHGAVYDSMRNVVVVYGGRDPSGARLDDTWELDCASMTWTETVPQGSGPGAREEFGIAYDRVLRATVMFGGLDTGPLGDTWKYDGSGWIEVFPSGAPPAARWLPRMAYSSTLARLVLFGGTSAGGGFALGDTWLLDTTTMTWESLPAAAGVPAVPARYYFAMVSIGGDVYLEGGTADGTAFFDDVWCLSAATMTWTNVTPAVTAPARNAHDMAYDCDTGMLIVFGGFDGSSYLADTWTTSCLPSSGCLPFLRGDCNGDGAVDIGDAITALDLLFGSGATACEDACDANDDGNLDIGDPISVLSALFAGAGPLPLPGRTSCGFDPTPDSLSCVATPCP